MYVLPCQSSSFTILWLSACCVLSGPFVTAGSQAYISLTPTVLVVIVGAVYFFESRIHKVAIELPNIIEGLV